MGRIMKKSYLMLFLLMSQQLSASSTLGSLTEFQGSYEDKPEGRADASSQVRNKSESSSEENGRCEENDQTSMPLAFATSLIIGKNPKFDVDYSPRTAKLRVGAGSMISNCSSMMEWKLKEQEVKGQKTYVVEAKFREGDKCVDGVCTYKVAKVAAGEFQQYEEMQFAPTLKGFEACLKASGVIKDGKVDQKAIYSAPLKQTFNNVKDTGKLLFVSHGPQSAMIKGKYGDFELINRCDHYEAIHPEIKQLLSYEDESRMRLDEEANKLKDCGVDEYHKLIGFIERYEEYASILGAVRDNLIMEAAKKTAKKIEEGKYTDEDLKVLADFEQYIVSPKVNHAIRLYQQMENLEGDAKRAKQAELKESLNELAVLNNKPYFSSTHTQKLLNDGRFEDAEKVNGIKITLDTYRKLGTKQNNVLITPEIAMVSMVNAKDEFAKSSIIAQERYQIRTGQLTGQADHYNNLVRKLQNSIQVRTQNYQAELQAEYQRIVPGGYCYAYYRNTQKCIQDSMERMQELQNLLAHYNKIDNERIAEYKQSAEEYGKLEAEGRRYVAQQNGEAVEEAPEAGRNIATDTTAPPQRAAEGNATVQADLSGNANMVQMANQLAQMYQQQQMMQQQQPQMGGQWWNQQGMGQNQMMMGGSMNVNMGMGAQYGSNYMSNPYQAYNYQYRGF